MIPVVPQSEFQIAPISWLDLHREYQNPGELEILVALVRLAEARSMLEIGCRDGRTAKLLLHNVVTLERYIGVDVPMSYQPEHEYQRREMTEWPGEFAVSDPRFELIIRKLGSLDLTANELQPFDIAYIDGDHGERAVRHDSLLAFNVVRPGGLIVWHDYNNDATIDVKRIVDKFYETGLPIRAIERTWFAYCINGGSDAGPQAA
jgi:predicted O-methyltransferase YrrM